MRGAKCIVLMMLVLFGFVMQNEMFQRGISGAGADRYLSIQLSYSPDFGEDEYAMLISDIEMVSEENGVHPYAILYMPVSDIERRINIYGDEFVKAQIQRLDGVCEQEYKTLSAGAATVSYHPFSDLRTADGQYVSNILFIGEQSDVMAVYETLSGRYEISRPVISEGNEADMTCIIWSTINVIMAVMTVLFIAVKKKEIVIKISMGQSPGALIMQNILTEAVSDFLVFFFVKWICSFFISGEYMEREFTLIYAAGVALSALLYLSFAVYDIRMTFSNAVVSQKAFRGIYCLKFVVTLGTILTVCTNLDLIQHNITAMSDDEYIKTFQDRYYITISPLNPAQTGDGASIDKLHDIAERIYVDGYEEFMPVVSTLALRDYGNNADYVLVNEYGADTIKDFLAEAGSLDGTEVAVFVPGNLNREEILAEVDYCLSKLIKERGGLEQKIFVYDGNKTFSYVDRSMENSLRQVRNPIVIYAGFSGVQYKDLLCMDDISNIMFRMEEDASKLEADYRLREQGCKVILTNAEERFRYYNAFLKQGISFCSSIAVFMFLLQMILVYVVVLLEYKNNALELSLKKILGYGFWQRGRFFLLKSMIAGTGAALTGMLVGSLTGLYRPLNGLLQGMVIILVEMVMDFCFVLKNEKENTMKVLKGGCL